MTETPRSFMRIVLNAHTTRVCVFALFISLYIAALPQRVFAAPGMNATELVSLTNRDRLASNLLSLEYDSALSVAAQKKADDMLARQYFSHKTPDGLSPWTFFKSAHYYYTKAAENLAIDFNDSTTLESAWMDSPTHHANIVSKEYSRLGFGMSHGMYDGRETTFVVEFFAAPMEKNVKKDPSRKLANRIAN